MNIKKSLLAATILSTAVAVPAWAGTTGSMPPGSQAGQSPSAAESGAASVAGISTRKLVGASVHDPEDERIGEAHDLVVGEGRGVTHAVIDVGGFLGIGEKRVAVPFTELKIDDAGDIIVAANREDLETRPAFNYSTGPDYTITADNSTAAGTSEERQRFVEQTERQMDEWGRKVGQFTEEARQDASEASEAAAREVSEAWDAVQVQWAKFKEASADAWENGKSSFEETWNEFERTWTDAESKKS